MRTSITELTNLCMVEKGDEILVLDRRHSSWQGIVFPGGHIEAGESFTDGVIREVREETGLSISDPRLCGLYDWMQSDGSRYLVFLYRAAEFTGELQASDEGNIFWVKKQDFLSLDLAIGMEEVFAILEEPALQEYFHDPATGEKGLYPSTRSTSRM